MPEKTKKEQKADGKTFQIKRIRGENFGVYYANGVQIAPTQWDVQFVFEQAIVPPAGSEGTDIIVKQDIAIIMSHEHARRFLEFFQKQLATAKSPASELEKTSA